MSGHKIIDGLKDAIAGNFVSVTIEGQTWVRKDAEIGRLRAALTEARGALATLDHMNGKDDGLAVIRGGVPVGKIIDAALGVQQKGREEK